jgi:lipoate-protein ligase A
MSPTKTTSNYAPASWRLIIDSATGGAWNMAVDEALTISVADGSSPPVLRFYAWQPGCLSLGYAQPASDIHPERLHNYGWDAVRRMTGGRAILHIDELTYSVVIPLGDPRVEGGVIESYRRLSDGLMAGLALLGVPVEAGRADKSIPRLGGPVCFEVPSDYEITAQGKKLLGSAQTRRKGVVLQHGALPLFGDIIRICDALDFPSEDERDQARTRLLDRAVTLSDVMGRSPEFAEVADALAQGFGQALNLSFEVSQLASAEETCAEELRAEKYASREWTNRH